jgi:hypothetical protein
MPTMNFMTKFYRNQILSGTFFSRNSSKIVSLAFMATIILSVTGCEDAPSKLGSGLLPGSDYLTIMSDTFGVKSYTLYSDSVKSDEPTTSYLGQIYDPYFGTTSAEFVSQMRLVDSMTAIGQINVDSVKLFMKFLTVKGDTSATHYLKISEISRQLYLDSSYYSNQTVPLTGKVWDNIAIPTLKDDTINSVEIMLPNEFGEYLTRDKSKLFISNTRADFRSYFKGLYFQLVSPANPIFLSLSLSAPGSYEDYTNYITVYMHNEVGVSESHNFLLNPKIAIASYNLYKHDFSTGTVGKKIEHLNDKFPDSLTYAQNMNGVYTRIQIPGIAKMKNNPLYKNIGINKARLIVPYVMDRQTFTNTTIPSVLYLRYITSSGTKYLISDYATAGSAFYDGTPDTTNVVYNINLATYLQDYLEDTKDSITPSLEMFLIPTSDYNVVFRANANTRASTKFELVYTKF